MFVLLYIGKPGVLAASHPEMQLELGLCPFIPSL